MIFQNSPPSSLLVLFLSHTLSMTTCTDCSEEYDQDDFKSCPRCYCAKTVERGVEKARKFYRSKMEKDERLDEKIEAAEEVVTRLKEKKRKLYVEIKNGIEIRTPTIWEVTGKDMPLHLYFTEKEAKDAVTTGSHRFHKSGLKIAKVPVARLPENEELVIEDEDIYD